VTSPAFLDHRHTGVELLRCCGETPGGWRLRTWRATARHVELLDDTHAFADLPVVKPKHEMTEREHRLRQAFAMVGEKLVLDGDSRRNLTPPIKPFATHWDC
jgi:hypothetical protein